MTQRNLKKTALIATILLAFMAVPVEACEFVDNLMPWNWCKGNDSVATYAPPFSMAEAPALACCPTQTCAVAQTACYVPQTCYRASYQTMPVTAYRPVSGYDACTGCPVTYYRPVTTYQRTAQLVPYTTYRMVWQNTPSYTSCYSGCATSCSPCATGCATGGSYYSGATTTSGCSSCATSTTTTISSPSTTTTYPSGSYSGSSTQPQPTYANGQSVRDDASVQPGLPASTPASSPSSTPAGSGSSLWDANRPVNEESDVKPSPTPDPAASYDNRSFPVPPAPQLVPPSRAASSTAVRHVSYETPVRGSVTVDTSEWQSAN